MDVYHARQHLWEISAKQFPNERDLNRWMGRGLGRLNQGGIEALVKILREPHPPTRNSPRLGSEADYFERNAARMRYPGFRAQGLLVGSGVVEACCKTVVATRLKWSGMFGTVYGANAIIALRCCRLRGRFEDYWEARSQARPANRRPLTLVRPAPPAAGHRSPPQPAGRTNSRRKSGASQRAILPRMPGSA